MGGNPQGPGTPGKSMICTFKSHFVVRDCSKFYNAFVGIPHLFNDSPMCFYDLSMAPFRADNMSVFLEFDLSVKSDKIREHHFRKHIRPNGHCIRPHRHPNTTQTRKTGESTQNLNSR